MGILAPARGGSQASSKAGLDGLSRSLAAEWGDGPGDVTANTVMIGPIYQEADPADHFDLPVDQGSATEDEDADALGDIDTEE